MNQFYHFPPKGFIQLGLNLIHFGGRNLTISLKSESIYLKSILRRQNKFKRKTIPFATTYLYESEFPTDNAIKIKFRNKVDAEADIK